MSTIDKKFIQCPTKALFNTKLGNNEFNSQSIVFIKDTGEIWTHGTFFGGLFTPTDTNYGKLNIGGTVTNLSLYGHKHSYTELTGYSATPNQAIVVNDSASGWTLKTLGSRAFDSTAYLPLAAGSGYPLTGDLYLLTASNGIRYAGHSYNIIYSDGTNTLVGELTGTTYLRSGNTNLIHNKNGTTYTIYDSSNLNPVTTTNYSNYLPFLNSTSTHATNTSIIYAPTTVGTSGYVLQSSGNGAPTWVSQSVIVGSYLPLAGGTIKNSTSYPLTIETTASTYSGIAFKNSSGLLGYIGMNSTDGLDRIGSDGTSIYRMLDSVNYKTYALSLSGGTMSNTNVVTNLNADLLDGKHLDNIMYLYNSSYAGKLYDLPPGVMFSGSDIADAPTTGWTQGFTIAANWNGSHYQHYLVNSHNDSHWYSGDSSNPIVWSKFAYITDNVASASKLETSRTIWGQSFDGSNNITGTFLLNGGTLSISDESTYRKIQGTASLCLNPAGNNVGIGTTSPSYALEVGGVSAASSFYGGHLIISDSVGIQYQSHTSSILYSDGTNSFLGELAGTSYIRSGNTNLVHRRNGTDYTIWDAYNDGSDSNLDADMVDGFHNGSLTAYKINCVATLNSGNGSTVSALKTAIQNILVSNSTTKNMFILLESIGESLITNWGSSSASLTASDYPVTIRVTNNSGTYASLDFTSTSSSKYHYTCILSNGIFSDIYKFKFADESSSTTVTWSEIVNKPFTWTAQTGQPTYVWGATSSDTYYIYNPANFSVNYATTAGTATSVAKLTTARSLWGQSFDGSADITGAISGCSRISNSGSSLYLGNSNNASYVYVQDMCSQNGSSYWTIAQAGTAKFSGSVTAGSFVKSGSSDSYVLLAGGGTKLLSDIGGSATTSLAWSAITNTPTTLSGYGITDAASSSHTHTFSSITSKPTTLSGYGITDAYISGSTIYLGSNSIVIPSSTGGSTTTIYTLTLNAGAFTAGSFKADSANAAFNIPTTTSHISEGSNLYYTNARVSTVISNTSINAATLEGHASSYFALATDISDLSTLLDSINGTII